MLSIDFNGVLFTYMRPRLAKRVGRAKNKPSFFTVGNEALNKFLCVSLAFVVALYVLDVEFSIRRLFHEMGLARAETGHWNGFSK